MENCTVTYSKYGIYKHSNVRYNVTLGNRKYVDILIFTQRDTYQNILNVATSYTEHSVRLTNVTVMLTHCKA